MSHWIHHRRYHCVGSVHLKQPESIICLLHKSKQSYGCYNTKIIGYNNTCVCVCWSRQALHQLKKNLQAGSPVVMGMQNPAGLPHRIESSWAGILAWKNAISPYCFPQLFESLKIFLLHFRLNNNKNIILSYISTLLFHIFEFQELIMCQMFVKFVFLHQRGLK